MKWEQMTFSSETLFVSTKEIQNIILVKHILGREIVEKAYEIKKNSWKI